MRQLFFLLIFILNFSLTANLIGQEIQAKKYWVFFSNKAQQSLQKSSVKYLSKELKISEKALKRRSKVSTPGNLIDRYDIPVDEKNVSALTDLGLKPIIRSKWLNAVSVYINTQQLQQVKKLSSVVKIRTVAKPVNTPVTRQHPVNVLKKSQQTYKFDYGNSLTQNELINVPAVHDFGITGEGILIGIIDSGFKHSGHEAFTDLKLISEFDFVNDDNITENETGQDISSQHNHGTSVLSVLAGFKEGQLIGTAFNASIMLAKTEYLPAETTVEEDYWVAGIEWLESNGADIVSSSLGYTTFTDTSYYTQADMDGNTAITTIAADIAVKKGVVVITSAGNEGNNSWGIISSPADGDSVIAVGGVDSNNIVNGFSSRGPTADGRTKPDVVAMGQSVFAATPSENINNSNYSLINGTSFSCPAVAGVAGLILEAHPYLTPLQVRNALRSTADNSLNPNNDIGWGLVDAYDAILFHGPAFSANPEVTRTDNIYTFRINADSKNGVNTDEVYLGYKTDGSESIVELKMNIGSKANLFQVSIADSVLGDSFQYYFKLTDLTGISALHPYNAPDSFFTYNSFPVNVDSDSPHPEVFELAQNFPNPFNPRTHIVFDLKIEINTILTIYNRLGQEVKTLENKKLGVGQHTYFWDGTDQSNQPVVSGIYFYKIKAGKFSQVKKMALIR